MKPYPTSEPAVLERQLNAVAVATVAVVNLALNPLSIPWIWNNVQRPLLETLGVTGLGLTAGLIMFVAVMAACVAGELVALVLAVTIAFRPHLTIQQAWRVLRRKPI